jgi:hypothetical protein
MGAFLTILSALVTLCKAVLAGLSVKEQLEKQAEDTKRKEAIQRHADNEKAISDLTRKP